MNQQIISIHDNSNNNDFLKNPFMMHCLFDPYIADNIGSPPSYALGGFRRSLKMFNNTELKNLENLLAKSNDIATIKGQLQERIKLSYVDDAIFSTSADIDKKLDKEYQFAKTFDEFKLNYLDHNISVAIDIYKNQFEGEKIIRDSNYCKIDNLKSVAYLHKCVVIPSIIKTFISNVLDNNEELFMTSGYYNINEQKGHLIGLYYKKNNENNYKVVLTNSGQGLEFSHIHKKKDDEYGCIIEKNNIGRDQLEITLYHEFYARGLVDPNYTIENYYNNVVSRIFINEWKSYYRHTQYSGSCTFYGIYYFIDYYLSEKSNLFNEWFEFTKKKVVTEVVDYITDISNDHKINNNSNIKNYIDLLQFKYSNYIDKDKIQLMNNNYKQYVTDCTNVEGNNDDINTTTFKIATIEEQTQQSQFDGFEQYEKNKKNNIHNSLIQIQQLLTEFLHYIDKYRAHLEYQSNFVVIYFTCMHMKIFYILWDVATKNDTFYKTTDIISSINLLYNIFGSFKDIIEKQITRQIDDRKHIVILFIYIFVRINDNSADKIIKNIKENISDEDLFLSTKLMNVIFSKLTTKQMENTLKYSFKIFPYHNLDISNLIKHIARYIDYFPRINDSYWLSDKTITQWATEFETPLDPNILRDNTEYVVEISKPSKHKEITIEQLKLLTDTQKRFLNVKYIPTQFSKKTHATSSIFVLFLEITNYLSGIRIEHDYDDIPTLITNDQKIIFCNYSFRQNVPEKDMIKIDKFKFDKNKMFEIPLDKQSNNLDYLNNLILNDNIKLLTDYLDLKKTSNIGEPYLYTMINIVVQPNDLNENYLLNYNGNVNIANKLFNYDEIKQYLENIRNKIISCNITIDTFIGLLNIMLIYGPNVINPISKQLEQLLIGKIDSKQIDEDRRMMLKIIYTICYNNDVYMNDIIYPFPKNTDIVYFQVLLCDHIIFNNPKMLKNIFSFSYGTKYDKIHKTISDATNYFSENNITCGKKCINGDEIQLEITENNKQKIWNVVDVTRRIEMGTQESYSNISIFENSHMFYYENDENIYYGIPITPLIDYKIKIDMSKKIIFNGNYEFISLSSNGIKNDQSDHILKHIKLEQIISKISKISDIANRGPNPVHNILLWKNTNKKNEYLIELLDYKLYNSTKTLKLSYINGELWYEDYKIITSKYNPIINNWVYGLKNAFIMENKNNRYDRKLLLLKKNYDDKILIETIWNNKKSLSTDNPDYQKKEDLNFYIINIHYSGLLLIFNEDDALYQYFLNCVYFSKTDCIDVIFNNFIQASNNNDEYKKKHPKTYTLVAIIFRENLGNIPYKFYYSVKCNTYYNRGVKSEYTRRMNNGKYPQKYKIELDEIKPEQFKYIFKYNKLKNAIQKIITDEDIKEQNKKQLTFTFSDIETPKNKKFDDKINISNYKEHLKLFIESYKTCNPEIINVKLFYKDIFEALNKKFEQYLDKLYQHFIQFSDKKFIEQIYILKETFYGMIECKNMIEILNEIRLMKNKQCYEVLKLQDMLDTEIIYNGIRDISVTLFEILFGSFIRRDQYDLYDKINNEKNVYDIHHMLMGKGKSSVITPLLTLKNIFSKNISNVIITMPDHLTKQMYDSFTKQFSCIMENIIIQNMTVDRGRNPLIENKNIIIIDDASLKSIKLNTIISGDTTTSNIIKDTSYVIMDEFDSMINPLSSELNFPEGIPVAPDYSFFIFSFTVKSIKKLLKNNQNREIHFIKYEDSQQYINDFFINNKYNDIMSDYLKYDQEYDFFVEYCIKLNENVTITTFNSEFFVIVGILRKIYKALILALTYIYRKDYGFGNVLELKKNSDIAIPYKAVDSPVDKSEFTDPEFVIVLTTFSYFYKKLIQKDFINIIEYAKQAKKENPDSFYILFDKYIKLINTTRHRFDYVLECHNNFIISDITSDIGNNLDLIENYLIDILLPKYIKIFSTQYNCSFIDVMTSTFTKYKTAFSGTVNVSMPRLAITQNEFNSDIKHDSLANGETVSAIVGAINPNKCEYIKNDISVIINYLIIGKYQCIIDTGAFLKAYSSEEVVRKIVEMGNNEYKNKKYIFIDDKHKKKVYQKDNDIEKIYDLGFEKYETEDIFMYYDHKHTVGIDIKQPYKIKGLATINYFNRFTDIAQGIFRLRKLNYGHTIDFIVSEVYRDINATPKLFDQLIKNEIIYKNGAEKNFILQNIKYLRREQLKTKESYIDKIFYENIISKEDLGLPLQHEYIMKNYCNNQKDIILDLCKQLDSYKDMKMNMGTHKAQNINIKQNVEIDQFKNVEKAKFDYNIEYIPFTIINKNYTIKDYLDINVYGDDKSVFEHIVVNFLHQNKIYLSPFIYTNINQKEGDVNILAKNMDTYLQLRKHYKFEHFVFYYIKKKINNDHKYLILFPNEYQMLHEYLIKNKDNNENITIKNNYGKIMFGNQNDQMTIQESIIQIITGNTLQIKHYIMIFEYLNENQYENQYEGFEKLLQMFGHESIKLYQPVHIVNFLIKNPNFKDIINQHYSNNNYNDLLAICGISVSNLSDRAKEQIITSDNVFGKILNKNIKKVIMKVDMGSIHQLKNINSLMIRKNYIVKLLKSLNENKKDLYDEIQKRKLEIYKKHDIAIEEMKKLKHVSGEFTISDILVACLNKSIGNRVAYDKINEKYKNFISDVNRRDWKYNNQKVNVPEDSYMNIINDSIEKRATFSYVCGNVAFMVRDCGDNEYVKQFRNVNAIDGYSNILKVNEKYPIGRATNIYLYKEIQKFFDSYDYYIKDMEPKPGSFLLFVFYVPAIKTLMEQHQQLKFAGKTVGSYEIIEFMDKYCEHGNMETDDEYVFYQYENKLADAKLPDGVPIILN